MTDEIHDSDIVTPEDITDETLFDRQLESDKQQEPGLVVARELLPPFLSIMPLSNRPLFPGLIVPLVYEGEEMIQAFRQVAKAEEQYVGLILVRDEEASFSTENLFEVGVAAKVVKAVEIAGHGLHIVVECIERFKVRDFAAGSPHIRARVAYHAETSYADNIELKAYTVAIINTIKELLKHNPLHEEELQLFLSRFGLDEPNHLADFAASMTTAGRDELQEVLETYPIFDRMKKVMTLLNREMNVSKIQKRIRSNIDERISEQQRKFFLNEQLHEIQRELGMEEDPRDQEIKRLEKRAKKLAFPDEASAVFAEEMHKLSMLDPSSPEYGVSRNYLDWLTSLPWGKFGKDRLNLKAASRALNRHHSGLEDVKDRILEFIAVGVRKKEVGGSIILFVGPPGVGKTSIGRAIAEAVNRPFYRFSVGGMRDEAEIKGHRRTYIGAMPGKIVQALKQVKAANPVIMMDEVDKIGSDFRGDPSSALLEVLDPEQNSDFLDHYLDVRFDLSRVLFLLTANQLDTVPKPLLDRAEIIHLAGYIAPEKMEIARKHLWPRLLEENGLKGSDIKLGRTALARLVDEYAREPGVRRLERLLKKIQRKAAIQLVREEVSAPISIGARNLDEYAGKPRFRDKYLRQGVGLATGLAWTALGGVTLMLEVTVTHHDRRGLKLTGQLGKVMQESAEIAYSYVTANLARFGAPPDFFDKAFVHLHVPEGAVPKDGPSAGITMATALLSLALGKVPLPMAMTGEMTLTGDVLPIGGEREKLLAAKRLNISEVILPAANQVDVEELPESVPQGLTIHYVRHFNDVARLLFGLRIRPVKVAA
ncbi:MAG: endopeptidase La [Mariprofundaceae bacterium]|nr:endopeptidase La [Mariprofundaceae bacterium]